MKRALSSHDLPVVSSIGDLPVEVLKECLFPWIGANELQVMRFVSKKFHDLAFDVAKQLKLAWNFRGPFTLNAARCAKDCCIT